MTAFKIFALVWPAVVGLLVIAVGFSDVAERTR